MFKLIDPTSSHGCLRWLFVALLLCGGSAWANGTAQAGTGFVDSIVKAPIAVDAQVAGRPTDVVVNLKLPQNKDFEGLALATGESIVVTLPAAFKFDGAEFPVCNLGDATCSCTPGTLQCTTAVFLQGWPQSPVIPDVSLEPGNRLVLMAMADTGPVIKQIHLITKGFTNPRAGRYTVKFERRDVDGAVHGRGAAQLQILRKVGASINVFSVPADGDPTPPHSDSIYQRAMTGDPPPFDWFFLVWDRKGQPMTDMSLQPIRRNLYWLKQGHRPVGYVKIHAPHGASGQSLELTDRGTITTPLIGTGPGGSPAAQVQQYQMHFTSGNMAGGYRTTLRLFRGNTINMHVEAEDP